METIKWSKRGGKQRYKCKDCGIFFTSSNLKISKNNQRVWFEKWVLERLTYRYLSKDSGYSISTLKRMFKTYLDKPPAFQISARSKVHLMIDGTYFSNDLCLILYQDNDIKYTQLYRFSSGEYYREIAEDLINLGKLGVQIYSVTCDGHKGMLKAIGEVLPEVTIQRCIVHIHRMSHIWLRKRPKTLASQELKYIINLLPLVKTPNDKRAFIKMYHNWYNTHKAFINEKAINEKTKRWWYRHKNLRRTATLISKALPDLFHFLKDADIPKSTNGLGSFFGHLKDNLSIHRGLSYSNRKSFIKWYLQLKNKARKQLEDKLS